LIDDVSAFAGKERSQEELYLLYNLMLDSNRQMAFTSPVAPGALDGMEERLVTRLSGGLVVELGVPDREARVREVERLLGPANSDPDLVEYLASRQAASLREVQQMVQRVTTASDEQDVALTLESARKWLDGDQVPAPRPPRRGSGLIAPGSGALRSGEKMVESWPEIGERLIEGWN
jgi:chromosomal replication initiator protein